MNRALTFVRVLALGAWIGAIVYFAAVVTRGAFAVLASRDEAGILVGFTLGGLHTMGLICAAIFVIASIALRRSLRALIEPAVLAVILMAALTAMSQYHLMPRMARLRAEMGSVDATPANDPRRAEFDRLHSLSVDHEIGTLAIGLIALFLTIRRDRTS